MPYHIYTELQQGKVVEITDEKYIKPKVSNSILVTIINVVNGWRCLCRLNDEINPKNREVICHILII